MKTARFIAALVGLLVAVIYTATVVFQHSPSNFLYSIIEASLSALLFGLLAYFITLGIGALIYELTKPRKGKI